MTLFVLAGILFFFLKTYFHGRFLEEVSGRKVFMFKLNKQPDAQNRKLDKVHFDKLLLDEFPNESSKASKLRLISNVFSLLFLGWLFFIALIGLIERLLR